MIGLLGMLGLVIDGGLMLASYRHAQNAADGAALAAAAVRLRGENVSAAIAFGTTYATSPDHNNLTDAAVTINIPPSQGPYAGNSDYAEALVNDPIPTYFIHALSGNQGSQVNARAVAGYEKGEISASIITLDPAAAPGFKISGNGDVTVYGGVWDNSEYGGYDENGDPVNSPLGGEAWQHSGDGNFYSSDVHVVGGVDHPEKIQNIDPAGASPLTANSSPAPDPYAFLPPPTLSSDPVNVSTDEFWDTDISDPGNYTLIPGLYHKGIKIQSDANVTFQPGIYILLDGGLQISGDGDVVGHGIMFYNTGNDYNVFTGAPDNSDGNVPPNGSGGSTFDQINLSGNGSWDFSPLNDSNSPFDGMFYYQRRANNIKINVSGNANFTSLSGMIYAKWADLYISGNGDFQSTFVVGSFEISGNGNANFGPPDGSLPEVDQIYLVE